MRRSIDEKLTDLLTSLSEGDFAVDEIIAARRLCTEFKSTTS